MTHNIEILKLWIRVVLVIASVSTTAFPILYSFSQWRSRPIGRVLMLQGISFAVAMDLSTLFAFWTPSSFLVIFWVDGFILTAIAVSTSWLTFVMWQLNHPSKGRTITVRFTNRVYDVLKRIAQIYLPAAGTLYFGLAGIWHLPHADEVVATVVALDTFLGVLLGISSKTYNNEVVYDGTMDVSVDEATGKRTVSLNLNGDPNTVGDKKELRFKVDAK